MEEVQDEWRQLVDFMLDRLAQIQSNAPSTLIEDLLYEAKDKKKNLQEISQLLGNDQRTHAGSR
jgi:hypothetical protein